MLGVIYSLKYSIANVADRRVRITVDAPTSSPLFYDLATVDGEIEKIYEARLSISRHFSLVTECNEENISTRQCQLLCRRKFLHNRCSNCRPSTLADELLGVKVNNETDLNQVPCTIQMYDNCYPKG